MNRPEPAFRHPVQSMASKDSAGARLICADRPFPGYFRDGCVSRERSLRLQKSPTRSNQENAPDSRDISKGVFSFGNVQVRSLRGQPATPAFGQAPQEPRQWAGNPGFSRIRLRLRTPGSPTLRWKSPKVSGLVRDYSRFAETIGGDWFDHHCRRLRAQASP